MPDNVLNLQLFAEDGGEMAGDSVSGGVATATAENTSEGAVSPEGGEQVATAQEQSETFETLIAGKYKDDYERLSNEKVKAAISKRFKNQKDLQGQIDLIDPIIRSMAEHYNIKANANGSIPIDQLRAAYDNDNSRYEEEAFKRGMGVEDLKQMKRLEMENAQLRRQQGESSRQEEWNQLVREGEALKEIYPSFDLEAELNNREFGKLLATLQKSGFPNPVKQAYQVVHMDDIMSGAMRHAVVQTESKISNAIAANSRRPSENGTSQRSTAGIGNMDPSKLTASDIEAIKMRAERGEKIVF